MAARCKVQSARIQYALVGLFFASQSLVGHSQSRASAGKLRVGTAKVDITPPQSYLQTPTDVIRDHIYVRGIVINDGSTCAALISIEVDNNDDVGVPEGIQRAAAATGCPAQNFIVSATHSHSTHTMGLGVGLPDGKQQSDAIVEAAKTAKANMVPALFGYGTTQLHLNINRDLSALKPEDRTKPNPEFTTDKTLSVIEFLREDHTPIAVYMNYAMHPTHFQGGGVISGDFPGEASRYLENLFDQRAVAVFSQGSEGDVSSPFEGNEGEMRRAMRGEGLAEKFAQPPAPPLAPRNIVVAKVAANPGHPEVMASHRQPVSDDRLADFHKAIDLVGADVTLMGSLIGAKAVGVMRQIQPVDSARIWGGMTDVSCPGRERDTSHPVPNGEMPVFKDGPDVTYRLGVLQLGDLNLVSLNTEPYTEIGLSLKALSPNKTTIVVGLANGKSMADYTYPDYAASRKVYQVAGSHLKPGCAEQKLDAAAQKLLVQSGQ